MIRSTFTLGPMSSRQRCERRFDGVCDRDQRVLFEEWNGPQAVPGHPAPDTAEPAEASPVEATAPAETLGARFALLTLGDAPVVVAVCSEPPAGDPSPGLVVDAEEQEREVADRLSACGAKRQALREMFEQVEACNAEVRSSRSSVEATDEFPLFEYASTAGSPEPADSAPTRETVGEEPGTRPVVMRFPARETAPRRRREGPRQAPDQRVTQRQRGRFSWRRMLVSAAVSGGLGSAALVILHWMLH